MSKMHQWVNTFISLVAVVISVIVGVTSVIGNREHISKAWGIKSLEGFIAFHKDDLIHKKQGFTIFIQNEGATPKDIAFIQTDKGDIIHWFYDYEDRSAVTLPAGKKISIFLDIEPDLLNQLEQADSLILINGIGDRKKIISKNHIRKVLELYKSSQ